MNRLAVILSAVLATAAVSFADTPRFAVVRVADIYRNLPGTAAFQKEIEKQRADLLRNERAENLRKALLELQTLQARVQEKPKNDNTEVQQKLARECELKRQETQTLKQDFDEYYGDQTKEINRRLVAEMRRSLNQIVNSAQAIATAKGFDGLVDSSGETNTGMPFMIYAKSAPDLTEEVKTALQTASSPTQAPQPR